MTPLPYVDGWTRGNQGNNLSVVPIPRFPFAETAIPETFTRSYDWEFQVPASNYVSRMAARTSWTNRLLSSEDFTNAAWTAANATLSTAAGTAPNGDATLNRLLETSATGEHSITQTAVVTAAATEASIFVAGGLTRTRVKLSFTDSAAAVFSAVFDVVVGQAFALATGTTARVLRMGDGQFQIVIRFTPAAGTGTLKLGMVSGAGTTVSFAGSTAAGAYLWGAQVNAGTDSPYISTTTAARTVLAPDRDPNDPFAYLVGEKDPKPSNSEYQTVLRTFCRIPRQQVVPNSRFVTKPDLPGTFPQVSGNSLIVRPDPNVARWTFYTQTPVSSDSGAPNSDFFPTSGTYTVTVGASTTAAITINATSDPQTEVNTLTSALNGLASVSARGSIFVAGGFSTVNGFRTGSMSLFFNAYNNGSLNAASLTGTGGFTTPITSISVINKTTFSIVINASPSGTFNGGTFTITIFGQTTAAIAYNASLATVQAAISALTNVGSSTVVVANLGAGAGYSGTTILRADAGQIGLTIDVALPAISANGGGLLPAGATASVTPLGAIGPNSFGTLISFRGLVVAQRTIATQLPHGITSTDAIVLTQGTDYQTLPAGSFTYTANSITLTSANGLAFSSSTLITAVGKANGNDYTSGSKSTRIKRTTDFYLLGVTPGVDTLDQIPLPVYQGDAASLLAAIFAGSTSINYEVGELDPWKNGPILMRTITTLNAATL
jgi:hypothetical protein